MTPEQEWLDVAKRAADDALEDLKYHRFASAVLRAKVIHHSKADLTESVIEVKNLTASLAHLPPELLSHKACREAAVDRFKQVRRFIAAQQ